MPHGGRRNGRAGKAYPNRADLRGGPLPVSTAPSTGYGTRAAQEAAQRAVPMGQPPSPAGAAGVPTPAPAGPAPGSLGDPLRPTERPGEPLTAGIATGAGPGPEALGMGPDGTVDELRALYMAFPNEDLRQLIEDADTGTG